MRIIAEVCDRCEDFAPHVMLLNEDDTHDDVCVYCLADEELYYVAEERSRVGSSDVFDEMIRDRIKGATRGQA